MGCSLTTDPQLEDWHIICLPSSGSSTNPEEPQSPNTLCERLASSVCHDRARYVRCNHSEILDLVAWLVWQKYEPINVPRQPSWNLMDDESAYGSLSEQETTVCKHSLLTLLETRSTDQIYIALLTIYVVSHSFRRLSASELTAAVQSTVRFKSARMVQLESNTLQWSAEGQLLELCGPILKSDADGNVTFAEPSMKKFILTVQLLGLEHGHGTMTQMCFEQIQRLGTMFIVRPWTRFREWFKSSNDWPLLNYVANYWWCHYRLVAGARTDLSVELLHMIHMALAGKELDQIPILLQRRIIGIQYNICQIYDLPELAAILRNMGASEPWPSTTFPSQDQWRHMRPTYGISMPTQICPGYEPTVADLFDAPSILCIRRDYTAAINAELSALHLGVQEDLCISPVRETDFCPPLLEHEHPHAHDWEKIDVQELGWQPTLSSEDWEFVRHENISENV
ncbi:hypothetical protein PMZ80_008422 [Knufia obscura]|uniref:Uncharacterized protein n=2 Tax=Knufia TaxID=430999 RepID=A0AAN8IKL7_9EURO|nr:hypothetical protein PMZ80_008422 [Knufia obscura]KAK5951307.1 hypothetical protein OHC33_007725 [Knufia fluminis]